MKRLAIGLLSVAAVATTALLVRQHRLTASDHKVGAVPAGETQPATISLDRMRELGL